MATIKATFFTFTKRDNSTLKPATGGVELSITWKEETDMLSPQLEVRYENAFNFNYCYIDFTGRYYKINQVTSIAYQTYLLQCEHDVLANWIDDAKGQSVYADYSSYDYDIWLDDNRITAGHNITYKAGGEVYPEIFNAVVTDGVPAMTECLGVITDTGMLNGIDIFYGSMGSLSQVIQRFSDLSFIDNLKSGSPWDAVCEAYYVPFEVSACHITQPNHAATVWDIDIQQDAIFSARCKHYSVNIALPRPANYDFRFCEKYIKYYLNIPFSGVITIPTSLVLKAAQEQNTPIATITYSADAISGQFSAEVKVAGISLGMYGANMKVNLQLGGRQTRESVMAKNAGLGAASAAGAAMFAGAGAPIVLAAGLAGAYAGIVKSAIDIPPLDTFGHYSGNGSLMGLGSAVNRFRAMALECDSNIEPATLTAIAGRPSGKVTTIQNGYIKTINASVAFDGLAEEVTAFNALLNGGVYVE